MNEDLERAMPMVSLDFARDSSISTFLKPPKSDSLEWLPMVNNSLVLGSNAGLTFMSHTRGFSNSGSN